MLLQINLPRQLGACFGLVAIKLPIFPNRDLEIQIGIFSTPAVPLIENVLTNGFSSTSVFFFRVLTEQELEAHLTSIAEKD